jgi:ABC-type nitrate/sulfonate/bicarbonate transport system permease component
MATARVETVPGAAAHRRARPGAAIARRLGGLASFVVFIALWQASIVIFDVQPLLLPAPGSVVSEFFGAWGDGLLWPAVFDSLRALFVGLAAALVTGVVLGLLIGSSRWLELIASPYLWGLFATPRIALAPLVILWLGFGYSSKVLLVFLSAAIPVTLSCKEGVQTVDESLVRAASAFGADKMRLFRHVVIPYTLPFIANGIRNGIARGFVGLLIIEITVGSGGIGTQVMRSMRQFNTARMFAYVAVLVVTALVLITLSRWLEARASRWREEVFV